MALPSNVDHVMPIFFMLIGLIAGVSGIEEGVGQPDRA